VDEDDLPIVRFDHHERAVVVKTLGPRCHDDTLLATVTINRRMMS
jgi:hypothetical protein